MTLIRNKQIIIDSNWSLNGKILSGVIDPIDADHVANKAYVDSVAAGLDPKASVRFATTSNIEDYDSGTFTISGTTWSQDGVTAQDGDRVLVKDQDDKVENGIYTVSVEPNEVVLTRSSDFDGTPSHEVSAGNYTFVETGDTFGGTGWVVLGDGVLVVDSSPIVWSQFSESTSFTEGDAISLTGGTIDVLHDGTTIKLNSSGQLTVDKSALNLITPITYSNLKTLKTNNSLEPGTRYYITDRDIWIDALDSNKLAMECKRHFRIIKDEFYTPHDVTTGFGTTRYLGIYGQTIARGSVPYTSSTIGGTAYYAIWGGRMWSRQNNITGGPDIPGPSNSTIQSGWTMAYVNNDTFYESKIFDIKYNFDDDIIWEQSDDRGNVIKRVNSTISYIDITDWGNSNIYNNKNFGIYNNFRNVSTKATIYNNSNIGYIGNNSNNGTIVGNSNSGNINNNLNGGDISGNSNKGSVYNNSNSGIIRDNLNGAGIYSNSTNGSIYYNSNSDAIFDNSFGGSIHDNSNSGRIQNNSIGGSIHDNSNGGHITNNSNISGTTTIRFNTNNGFIFGNNMNGSYLLEYNNNNGNIGSTSSITRNADITDAQVNK